MSTVQMYWGSSDIPSGVPNGLTTNYTSNARGLIIKGASTGPGCSKTSCSERTLYLTFYGRFYVSKDRMPYQGTEFTTRPIIFFDGQLEGMTGNGAWIDSPSSVCDIRLRQYVYAGGSHIGTTELNMPRLIEIVDNSNDSDFQVVYGGRHIPAFSWVLDRSQNLEIDIEVKFTMKLEGTGSLTFYNGNLEPGFTFDIPQWYINSNSIRISISPSIAHLFPGDTQQFRATVTGTSNTDVYWSASRGTITSTGLYLAPSNSRGGKATITAKSVADPSVEAQVRVNIDNPYL